MDLLIREHGLLPNDPIIVRITVTDNSNVDLSYNSKSVDLRIDNETFAEILVSQPLTQIAEEPEIVPEPNAQGGYDYYLKWQLVQGYNLELWQIIDNTNEWQRVTESYQAEYRLPTTGVYSRMLFKLVGRSTDDCDNDIESETVEFEYRTLPGLVPYLNMAEEGDCQVRFDWGAATAGSGSLFQYELEICKPRSFETGNADDCEWIGYPGCGFDGYT